MKLSPTMSQALIGIIEEYDRAVAFERQRWGEAHAKNLADKGIDPALICGPRTVHALAGRKLIEITRTRTDYHERLRKGRFGRRLGGTVKDYFVQFIVKPTDLGRTWRQSRK